MGGGTAAMLTMMLRDKVPELSAATAWAIACPACMTLQLARSCAPFVTTLVHGTDIVPTFSSGAIDKLRQEVRAYVLLVLLCANPGCWHRCCCMTRRHICCLCSAANVLSALQVVLRSLLGSSKQLQLVLHELGVNDLLMQQVWSLL